MSGNHTVYAIHDFEPENDDEIGFTTGEPIIVFRRDEGFNDGWWQGQNLQGKVGLFPKIYTSNEPPMEANSTLENKIDSLQTAISNMNVSTTSTASSHAPQQLPTPSTSTSTKRSRDQIPNAGSQMPLLTKGHPNQQHQALSQSLRNKIISALQQPTLSSDAPSDWSVDQVVFWLDTIGLGGSVADNFKDQEISGDILLELTQESLKELGISTFGKRFKVCSAIRILNDEINPQTPTRINPIPMERSEPNTPTPTNRSQDSFPVDYEHHDLLSPSSSSHPYADDDLVSNYSTVIRNSTQAMHSQSSIGHVSDPSFSPVTNATLMPRRAPAPPRQSAAPLSPILVQRHAPNIPISYISKTRQEAGRRSFSPNTKPQTPLPVAMRSSLDGIAQRMGIADTDTTPDIEGWLHKQGDRYKTWNKRWFVLKGPNMFYFKTPKDVRMRGIINLHGYRVIVDESIYPGKYCFKIYHERERTFNFYGDNRKNILTWVNALSKATISRDYSAPVMSSSTVPTVPLDVARRMRPRPPSVVISGQHKSLSPVEARPFSLTYDDVPEPITRVSMSNSSASQDSRQPQNPHRVPPRTISNDPSTDPPTDPPTDPSTEESVRSPSPSPMIDSGFTSQSYGRPPSRFAFVDMEEEDQTEAASVGPSALSPTTLNSLAEEPLRWSNYSWQASDYVDWVNQHVEHHISELTDLRTGQALVELLESLSRKQVQRPLATSSSMHMLDSIVAAFKFMGREGVDVNGRFTIKDVFSGNEPKIMEMLDEIRIWGEALERIQARKKESGGTFGEEEIANDALTITNKS